MPLLLPFLVSLLLPWLLVLAKGQWPDLDFAFGFGLLITRACFKNIFHFSFKGAPLQNRDLHPITRKPKITRAGGPGLRARLRQRGKEDFPPYLRGLKTARHDSCTPPRAKQKPRVLGTPLRSHRSLCSLWPMLKSCPDTNLFLKHAVTTNY